VRALKGSLAVRLDVGSSDALERSSHCRQFQPPHHQHVQAQVVAVRGRVQVLVAQAPQQFLLQGAKGLGVGLQAGERLGRRRC